ncbi:MAG TPA: hydrogen gas-evolving membrane-bound hydrogenase subunit E, partial [Minicystis sp.]|nr:hydrogen gas-evolving membrane-bound hydrogenase subunit E [Minicystis sp.]
MTPRARLGLFFAGVAALLAALGLTFARMPAAGAHETAYARAIDERVLPERHASDAVGAVTFDYRGFDTLGEESLLFAAVVGVVVLLRKHRDDAEPRRREPEEGRAALGPSFAMRYFSVGLVGLLVVFGGYVASHGQVSPGGGFQGGLVLASAPFVVYLAQSLGVFERIAPRGLVELGEACGVTVYVLTGVLGLACGDAFLANVLPLGAAHAAVDSGGTIAVLGVATGVAVACGFVVLALAFLDDRVR